MVEARTNSRLDDNIRLANSLNSWWALAGVDLDFSDTPSNWRDAPPVDATALVAASGAQPAAEPAPQPNAARTAPTAPIAKPPRAGPSRERPLASATATNLPDPLPDNLAAFQHFWSNHAALDADYAFGPRISPTKMPDNRQQAVPNDAAPYRYMVISDMPDRDDNMHLMTGRSGILLDRIYSAAGIDKADVYHAAILPWHVIDHVAARNDMDRWRQLALHHIHLVRPQQIILLGDLPNMALTQNNLSQNSQKKLFVNHVSVLWPATASYHPRLLFDRPGLKAKAWQDWQFMMSENHR